MSFLCTGWGTYLGACFGSVLQEQAPSCVPSFICVRHTMLGTLTRKFKKDSTMNVVYHWVGSLSSTQKYFSLRPLSL